MESKNDRTAATTIDELVDLCIAEARPAASILGLYQAVIDIARVSVILQHRFKSLASSNR